MQSERNASVTKNIHPNHGKVETIGSGETATGHRRRTSARLRIMKEGATGGASTSG